MLDKNYLVNLDKQHNRITYARITLLDIQENPLRRFEGNITQGSINVDGNSAVRRTCSLTMVTEDVSINDYYWTLNSKFKLEVGIEDETTKEIVWFKQGTYVITSYNSALSTSGYSITIQGKDKMCLLNGENGGSLPFEVDFGKYEEVDLEGNVKYIPNLLVDIIKEAVHHYGGEPFHNIIINDLDKKASELLEYKYDTPLYLIEKDGNNQYTNATLQGDQIVYVDNVATEIQNLPSYKSLINLIDGSSQNATVFALTEGGAAEYTAAKIERGQTMGYRPTDLTYAGDLIGKAGESITSILDKIKNMLGNYEYFYDLDGRFVFQEQENYLNTSWSPIVNSDEVVYVDQDVSRLEYTFKNGELVSSFSNAPNLSNLKNDYSVWGSRKGVGGADIAIHMRYAIDEKPVYYKSIQVDDEELTEYNKKYGFTLTGQDSVVYEADKVDWRELIYQMAVDYRKYNHLDDFELRVAAANPEHYPTGKTGYEQYYIDIEGFWRQLYKPNGHEDFVKISAPTKEDIDKYYIKTEIYEEITKSQNGIELYRKVGNNYIRTYKGLPGEDGKYYKKNIDYRKVITPSNAVDNIYIKDMTQNGNVYEYNGEKERDILAKWESYSSKATIGIASGAPQVAQLKYNIAGSAEKPVKVVCEASGNDLKYEWYAKNIGGKWYRAYTNSNIYQVNALKEDSTNRIGREIYCKVIDKNGNCAVTESVTLTPEYIRIIKQPKNTTLYFEKGSSSVTIATVEVENFNDIEELSYQWYYKNKGEKKFLKSSIVGNTYSVDSINDARIGRQIYCEITAKITGGAIQKIKSKTYTIAIGDSNNNGEKDDFSSVSNVSDLIGDGLSFSAARKTNSAETINNEFLTGEETITISTKTGREGVVYNWYTKPKDSNTYSLAAQTFDTNNSYSIGSASRALHDGMEVFCVVTNDAGVAQATDILTIKFRPNLEITSYDRFQSKDNIGNISISVETNINDNELKYEWQYMDKDKTYYSRSSVTGSAYEFEDNKSEGSRKGRRLICTVTDTITDQKVSTDPIVIYQKGERSNYLQYKYDGDKDFQQMGMTSYDDNSGYHGKYNLIIERNNDKKTIYLSPTDSGSNKSWYLAKPGYVSFEKVSAESDGTLKFTIDENTSGSRIYCVTQDGDNHYQTPTLTIRYPKKVILKPLDISGSQNKVICSVVQCEGGPNYKWYNGNAEIKDTNNDDTDYVWTDNEGPKQLKCFVSNYGEGATSDTFYLAALRDQQFAEDGIKKVELMGVDSPVWYYNPYSPKTEYYQQTDEFKSDKNGWSEQVYSAPEQLNFWFDFLDSGGEINKFSTKLIGARQKVVNDKDVKAIYYRDIPEVTYDTKEASDDGLIQIPYQYSNMFSQSSQGKSAKDAIDNLLYNHACCIESITMSTIPIYHLEPNKRILVQDNNYGINGEYIASKFTLPLTYNGMMSITATKVVERLI